MSEGPPRFAVDWLALRERADHRARRPALEAHVADTHRVIDLAAGTGSTLRHLALRLAARRQLWVLVDADPEVLRQAEVRLLAWATDGERRGSSLALRAGGRELDVRLRQADLRLDLERLLDDSRRPGTLVAASAFLDLASAEWVERFVAALGRAELPALVTLTYDGRAAWVPPHAADAEVLAAVNAHQRRDKGLGPALGPQAAAALRRAAEAAGFRVEEEASDWVLDSSERALQEAFAQGWRRAAHEQGAVPQDTLDAWWAARAQAFGAGQGRLRVGHRDLVLVPPPRGLGPGPL